MTGRVALVFMLTLISGACTPPAEPIRIGVLLWPPYDLAHLAEAEGFSRPEQVRLIDYQTPAEVVRAYRNGLIDGLFLTTQFALGDHPGRADTRIIYVINISDGGDSLLARPELTSLDQLAGKTIALEAGPLGVYMLQRVLDRSGLSHSDVNLHFVDTPGQVDAYVSGPVDAVITYEPFRSRLLATGAVELFTSRDIANEIVDVLYVSEALVETRQRDLTDFVRGLDRARALLESDPEHALTIMARRHGMDGESFARTLEGAFFLDLEQNLDLLGGQQPALSIWIAGQVEVFERAGMLEPGDSTTVRPTEQIVARALE